MVHSLLPVPKKILKISTLRTFSTWLLPSSASCHSAKPQLLRSTQHYNLLHLLHLSPAQWNLVPAQQLLPSAHSRSHALVYAGNILLHYPHSTLGANGVDILSSSMRMPALLQYRILSFYLKVWASFLPSLHSSTGFFPSTSRYGFLRSLHFSHVFRSS